ncbi:MAG: dihydroneopterin aldolase [Deltaproteobacteria bacterium]|nr:dihydroneopterin aldolase [Deltaproteobacteria bacterium]
MEIHISGFPVFMKLGYFSKERLSGQEVLVSLSAEIIEFSPSETEDLSASVDYGRLISLTEAVLKDQEVRMIETAVFRLGQRMINEFPRISRLFVKVEKPILPDGMGKGARVSVSHLFRNSPGSACLPQN